MIGREPLARGVVALLCIAAASCARVADDRAAQEAVVAGPPAAVVLPSPAEPAARREPPASMPVATPDESSQDSIVEASSATEPELASATEATPETSLAEESPVNARAAPVTQEAEHARDFVASAVASPRSAEALDFGSLVTRLRKTKAINLRTKFAVKSESDELLERFRAYHARHGTATLAELRQSYDSLFLKLHSLLRDADPPLARDIDRSRGAIWEVLADPAKFGASAPLPSAPGSPPA